jgi:hypothetical protein
VVKESHLSAYCAQSTEYKIKARIPHKLYKEVSDLSDTTICFLHAVLNNEAWFDALCKTNVINQWTEFYNTFTYNYKSLDNNNNKNMLNISNTNWTQRGNCCKPHTKISA